MASCSCLCIVVHPEQRGICQAEAVTARTFYAESTGHVEVPMCGACAGALAGQEEAESMTDGSDSTSRKGTDPA